MPMSIVRQPDGKLAAFSSVSDDFEMWSADENDAVRFCVEVYDLGPKAAADKVRRGVEDHEPWKHGVRGHGLSRWNDALRTVAFRHGRDGLAERLGKMGFPDYDLSVLDLSECDEREEDMRRGAECEAADSERSARNDAEARAHVMDGVRQMNEATNADATEGSPKVLSSSMVGLLRHNEKDALEIDGSGWAEVGAVVAAVASRTSVVRSGHPFDRDVLFRIVRDDAKGRFEIDPAGTRIRAVSGHSIDVDLGLEPYVPTGPLWFGTVVDHKERIAREGMTGSAKRKVRLLEDREAAEAVAVSRGCGGPMVLEIDAPALAAAGLAFGRNTAGEILVDRFGPGYAVETALLSDAPTPGRG